MKILVSVISILLGFVAGALLMLSSGANPLTGFSYLFQGGLKSVTRICNTIAYAVPLMLTGLSVTFAFKTGLFNIGAPGQMLIGGLLANVLALTVDLPRPLLLPLVITASIVGGMVWAGGPRHFSRQRFNVNEVVSCIMMNWVAYWVVYTSSPTTSNPPRSIPSRRSSRRPLR